MLGDYVAVEQVEKLLSEMTPAEKAQVLQAVDARISAANPRRTLDKPKGIAQLPNERTRALQRPFTR